MSADRKMELREKLRDYVVRHGLRESEQRWIVGEIVLTSKEHLSSQDVVRRVQKSHPKIGIATIYRNLKVLAEAGVIRESLIPNEGGALYEAYEEEHHDHVICLDCDAIFEFHDEEIEKLQDKMLKKMNFQHVRHRHVLYASCKYLSKVKGSL